MERCLNCMKEYEKGFEVCPHCGFVKGTPPKEIYHLIPGTLLSNRYEIGTVVGAGGFGVVYRAWDRTLEKLVAIKEYYPASLVSRAPGTKVVYIYAKKREEEYRIGLERFLEEARNMARFSTHPNIVNVYNFFEENNTAYCVMEYLEGISYKTYIKKQGGIIAEDMAVKVTYAVLDALTDIHKAGIIHRDIAPDNVMILNNGIIKLMDFGAARFSKGDVEKNLTIILKPGFAPPEQYKSRSKQGPFTDIYAVGAMLYRAVTGVMPEESTNRIKEECLLAPKELNAEISDNLNNCILRAMAVLSELRFQNTTEFKEALISDKKILDAEQELKRRRKKRKKGILIAAAALLVGIIVGTVMYDQKKAETVLKDAELVMWVASEPGQEEAVQSMYEDIVSGFTETYPQIYIQVKAVPIDEYAERLQGVEGTMWMPDIYDSSYLTEDELVDAQNIMKVLKRLEVIEYYGLYQYQVANSSVLKLPVTFSRPVIYVNNVLAADLEITNDMADTGMENAAEEVAAFYNGESEFLVADTSYYFDVQSAMAGKYEMRKLPAEVVKNSRFVTCFSLCDSASATEKNAAYYFLEYLLSTNAQYILCIQPHSEVSTNYGLPLNKETYATYVEINPEFKIFEDEWVPAFAPLE